MQFTNAVLNRYKKLIDKYKGDPRVQKRNQHNVLRKNIYISEDSFWKALVIAILSTQSRNTEEFGKNRAELEIDNYEKMKNCKDIANRIRQLKGIRYTNKKPESIARSMRILQEKWKEIKKHLETLLNTTSLEKEREVADYLRETFKGNQIGLKQSRNIIQMLGISQYVIPLDSRVMKVLEANGGIREPKQKKPLQSRAGYYDIEEQINELCEHLNGQCGDFVVKPCNFDICAFISQEN
ncbi:MAG: hypothetical protein K2N07_05480 [Desulfovibrio sp.]|nr:hypothetical protein [Desulfovibrio sp.]